jgi:hypothetical protein
MQSRVLCVSEDPASKHRQVSEWPIWDRPPMLRYRWGSANRTLVRSDELLSAPEPIVVRI